MAVTYGFYNSLNKDRMYNAQQMSAIFDGIITDGVFGAIGDKLMPVAGTGMQVIVKTGKCWFNSTWTLNDAQLPLDVEAADVSLTRIDAVVVEINSAVGTRANSIKVIKGTPSANPAKPTLSATETLHQYALGYITVPAGATAITAANIEVNVGKTNCPFITSVLQQTDITDLFNQWDAEFNAWFANVQSQLSGDIAANLQRQINENYANTLKPATAAMFGLSKTAVPDEVLAWLGKYAEHWWAKRDVGYIVNRSKLSKSVKVVGYGGSGLDLLISKDITVNPTTGEVSLANPTTYHIDPFTKYSGGITAAQGLAAKSPCYLKNAIGEPESVFFLPSGSTGGDTANRTVYWSGDEEHVVLNEHANILPLRVSPVRKNGTYSYIQTLTQNAYQNGIQGVTEYRYMGRPFVNLPTTSRVSFGKYIGTGQYGPDHPNQLYFDFWPIIVIISEGGRGQDFFIYPQKYGNRYNHEYGYVFDTVVDWVDNSLRWHVDGPKIDADKQLNTIGEEYCFVAIGWGDYGNH